MQWLLFCALILVKTDLKYNSHPEANVFLLWMYKQLCTEMAKLMKKKMYTKKCHTEKKLNVSLLNRGIECKPGLHGHRPLNSQ